MSPQASCYNTPSHPGVRAISEDPLPHLSQEQVEHICTLARLGLSQEDLERFRHQLSRVLEHFQALAQLDTEGIPPTAQVIALQNVMRSDEPGPSLPWEQAMANAPQSEEGYFKVRAVLEE